MAMKIVMSAGAESPFSDIELLTETQVAKAWKITPGSLRNARVSGRLGIPFVKLTPGKRGAVRYRLSDVIKHLEDVTAVNTRQARGLHADLAATSDQVPAGEGAFPKWACNQKEGE